MNNSGEAQRPRPTESGNSYISFEFLGEDYVQRRFMLPQVVASLPPG